MVPLCRGGPQGSILGPLFPGCTALEVYFMKDGGSLHGSDDDLNFLSFNLNEAKPVILSNTKLWTNCTFTLGSLVLPF